MTGISCKVVTSHTRKLAKDVFNDDTFVAWAVTPRYMREMNISREEDINPAMMKAWWEKQQLARQYELRTIPPHTSVKHEPSESTHDDVPRAYVDEKGNIIYLETTGLRDSEYIGNWFSANEWASKMGGDMLLKVRTKTDVKVFELCKAKRRLWNPSMSEERLNKDALADLDYYHQLKGFTPLDYEIVEDFKDGRLASINGESGKINVKKDISVDEFIDYVTGNVQSNMSGQKKAVLREMGKYGVTVDDIKTIVNNPYLVRQFLLAYERDHLAHREDWENYGRTPDGKPDLMHPNSISIETRASLAALGALTGKTYEKGNVENKKNQDNIEIDAEIHVVPSDETGLVTPVKDNSADIDADDVANAGNLVRADSMSPLYKLMGELTPVQISARTNMISHRISDAITSALKRKQKELKAKISRNEASEADMRLLADLSDEENGRRIGIPVVINDVLEEVRREIQETSDDLRGMSDEEVMDEFGVDDPAYLREQYDILTRNYDTLFDMACDILEESECLRLTRNGRNVNANDAANQENADEAELGDAENGERATGNEGYAMKARMLDPHANSRAVTRRILSGLHKINHENDWETDDIGEPVYVSETQAYSILVNEMAKRVKHPTDFCVRNEDGTYSYPALEALVDKYPWVKEILIKVKGVTGTTDPAKGSALYADLCKTFVPYWTQYETMDEHGNAKRESKRVNETAATESVLDEANKNWEEHVVTSDGMIWKKNGEIDNTVAVDIVETMGSVIQSLNDGDDVNDVVKNLADAINAVGVPISPEALSRMFKNNPMANDQARALATFVSTIASGAQNLDAGNSLIREYRSAYKGLADIIGTVSETRNSMMFRQGNATYPSFSTPNYIDFVMNGLKGENWEEFLMNEFGYDSFLYDDRKGKFRSFILRKLMEDKDARDNLDVKYMNVLDHDKEYGDWTRQDIMKAFVEEYFSVPRISRRGATQYGYYAFPIFSDTGMAAFIKMPRFATKYEEKVTDELVNLAKQELSRIKRVRSRKKAGASPIQRFDAKGDRFLFMPELNEVMVNGMPLVDYINSLGSDDIQEVDRVLRENIREIMERNASDFVNENIGLFDYKYKDSSGKIDASKERNVRLDLDEFYWNNALAQSQIIQLTTTDLAYYKDYTDFQKRFKEVYASGPRLNTQSRYGREKERVIYLSDRIMTSPTYDGIKASLEKAVGENLLSKEDMASILEKFRNVNATDAQAYRTLSSYRAVLDMQGKWTPAMQAAFDRFSQGKWSKEDFDVVWGTLKPFVFANLKVSDGLGGFQRVPHQNKNSEFLLLAFVNGMRQGNMMSTSPQLTGLNRAMEDFGIDTAMYESAVKAGGQGIIDISHSREKLAKWNEANGKDYTYEEFKKELDEKLDNGEMTQGEYNKAINDMLPSEQEVYDIIDNALHDEENANPTDMFDSDDNGRRENKNVLHEIPYEHYMMAQPTVNHVVDAESVFGSQFRNLITMNLPADFEITIGGKTFKGKDEILKLYQGLIVENLLDDQEKVAETFGDIDRLQRKLLAMTKGNPSYGPDILNALQIVEVDGVRQFNIPFHNPTVANKVEQLLLSMFKKGITQQYIKGAACVLVSNYGFDDGLKVLRDKNGGITGFECYMPAHTKAMFEDYLIDAKDNDGNVIGQKIDEKRIPKELLEGIGFRIPTEGKYSIQNLVIKGFLPQQNGSAVMMPAELTTLAGSDFDVDKLFIMLKESRIRATYDMRQAWRDFYADPENEDIRHDVDMNYATTLQEFIDKKTSDWSLEDLDALSDEDYEEFKREFREYLKEKGVVKSDFSTGNEAEKRFDKWFSKQIKTIDENGKPKYLKSRRLEVVEYDSSKEPKEMTRAQRNNMIIDITRAIMANPGTSAEINHPGNYDNISMEADRNVILRDKELMATWASLKFPGKDNLTVNDMARSLLNASAKELSEFLSKYKKQPNPLDLRTFAFFHHQNMVGNKLIGIYANNNTQQAKYQQSNLGIALRYQFIINGNAIGALNVTHRLQDGVNKLVSSNCAEFSAASVDNGKDPRLANLNQSVDNAFITSAMLRMGLTIKEIGLISSLPFYDTNVRKVLGKDSLAMGYYKSGDPIKVTSEELARVIIDEKSDPNGASKARATLARIITVAEELRNLTSISRADSPNGAIRHTLAGAMNQVMRVNNFHKREARLKVLTGYENLVRNGVSRTNSTKDELREELMSSSMPMLQAFHTLGVDKAVTVAGTQFRQLGPTMRGGIEALNREYQRENLLENMINKYLKEAVVFGLSKSGLFSKDMSKQRAYFLNNFATYFSEVKKDPKFSAYGIIKAMSVNGDDIILENASRLMGVRDRFSRDLDVMLLGDDPKARELALNLFKYSYFRDGLGWRVNGFSQFFDTMFLTSLPSYIDTLRELRFDASDNVNWNDFHEQFMRNHYLELFKDVTGSLDDASDTETVYLDAKNAENPNNPGMPRSYVVANGQLYKIDFHGSQEKLIKYDKVEGLAHGCPVYDASQADTEKLSRETSDAMEKAKQANDAYHVKEKASAQSRNASQMPVMNEDMGSFDDDFANQLSDMESQMDNEDFMNQLSALEDGMAQETREMPRDYDGNKETDNKPCGIY